MIIKVAATIFAIYAWSRVYARFKKRSAPAKELVFWTFVWLGVVAVVFMPGKTHILARLIGMGRGFDALVFASMLAIFYALYKITAKLKQMDQEITQLVSELALSSGAKSKASRGDAKVIDRNKEG